MANLLKMFLVLFVVVLSGCGTQSGSDDDGDSGASGVRRLTLDSDTNIISSGGGEDANFTVQALDANNAVVEGAEISLSSTGGRLSASSVTTDSSGEATFTLDSGSESASQVITVTASSGSAVQTRAISIRGTSVELTTDRASVGLNGDTLAYITATVTNGSGDPVENMRVTFDASLGTIDGSSNPTAIYTDSFGEAVVEFAGGSEAGTALITATLSENGIDTDTDTVSILLSDQQFTLSDSLGGTVSINGNDTLTLTWVDTDGSPVANESVVFQASKGTFDATGNSFVAVTTDGNGTASTVFYPEAVGTDIVSVYWEDSVTNTELQDSINLTILAGDPNSVALSVNPSVVKRALNGNTPTATVSATVLDAKNRAVQGAVVNFSSEGPGGGESIEPRATTNASGVASVTFSSGGLISAQDGVTILAKLRDYPTITDTATITIGEQAATITIGQTNVIQTITVGTAESAYALPLTVLVTDTNGSAISGQDISLSVYPTTFHTGYFADNTDYSTKVVTDSFANEDANRNGILDPGEDIVFNNGRLDPGGVVSIPSSVTTDSNGFAGFNLVYAKGYGPWVTVEVAATTNVSGTESKAVLTIPLSVESGDIPYLNSPFGL